jgi:hypothetical protein
MSFDEWYSEKENFSQRWERAHSMIEPKDKVALESWLRSAFGAGFREGFMENGSNA